MTRADNSKIQSFVRSSEQRINKTKQQILVQNEYITVINILHSQHVLGVSDALSVNKIFSFNFWLGFSVFSSGLYKVSCFVLDLYYLTEVLSSHLWKLITGNRDDHSPGWCWLAIRFEDIKFIYVGLLTDLRYTSVRLLSAMLGVVGKVRIPNA